MQKMPMEILYGLDSYHRGFGRLPANVESWLRRHPELRMPMSRVLYRAEIFRPAMRFDRPSSWTANLGAAQVIARGLKEENPESKVVIFSRRFRPEETLLSFVDAVIPGYKTRPDLVDEEKEVIALPFDASTVKTLSVL